MVVVGADVAVESVSITTLSLGANSSKIMQLLLGGLDVPRS